MATKISGLTELTAPASGDLLPIVDVSDTTMAASGSTRKITCDNLSKAINASNIASGTLALARGGTGASLADPNADRILFWDDSAGAVTWLQASTGLSISGTAVSVSLSITDVGDATGFGQIATGNNQTEFLAAVTTAAQTAWKFTESSAATGAQSVVLGVETVAASTAFPVQIKSRGDEILRGSHDTRQLLFHAGSASVPTFSFIDRKQCGIYSPGANQVGITTDSTLRAFWDQTGEFNLVAQAAPASPTAGDIWTDSTQKTLSTYQDGISQNLLGVIFTQTATVTVANSSAETTLVGGGVGSATAPANFFMAGKTCRIRASGYRSTEGVSGGALTFRVKAGSTALASFTESSPVIAATNELWQVDFTFTCRTTGGTGTVIGQGAVAIGNENTLTWSALKNTATVTVDTTASQALSVTADWDTADAANTISCTNFSIEVLN